MEVLGCYCENLVVLVMNFVEFVQGSWLMEESVSPVEEEVFQEVDEQELTK